MASMKEWKAAKLKYQQCKNISMPKTSEPHTKTMLICQLAKSINV